MKRFASHYLLIPAVGYMKQQVVEITDEGVVRGVFPLTEEIESVEWMPGVSVYESDDMVNWKRHGAILNSLDLRGIPDSAGVWAPALTYYEDTFYLIYTVSKQIDGYFKDVENYVITVSYTHLRAHET